MYDKDKPEIYSLEIISPSPSINIIPSTMTTESLINKDILLDSKKVTANKTMWQLITIALPIALVILFAFIFQWLHKRKYTI